MLELYEAEMLKKIHFENLANNIIVWTEKERQCGLLPPAFLCTLVYLYLKRKAVGDGDLCQISIFL